MVKTKDNIIDMVKGYRNELSKYISVNKMILFGSYAKDDAISSSDVDIAVISEDFQSMNFIKRLEFLQRYWKYDIGADILGYTPKEFDLLAQKISLVSEIIKTGIMII